MTPQPPVILITGGAQGIGPNLDELKPSRETVVNAVTGGDK